MNEQFLVEFFLAAMAAMPHELKLKTLQGGDLTVEVVPNTTIRELKAMLHEKKHCEDPIEHKILKVKVLADGLLVDDQTLESVGMLHAESEATVIYSRNEVDAAAKEAIHVKGFLQVNIPFSLTAIPARAFSECHQVVKAAIPESVKAIGERAFEGACLWQASLSRSRWHTLGFMPHNSKLRVLGTHYNPRVSDSHRDGCLCRL